MEYIISASTDIGIQKETNQDSLLIKAAQTPIGKLVFAVLCDGMGGLSKGEVASASLIRALEEWFCTQLPKLVDRQIEDHLLRSQWEMILKDQNERIQRYGRQNGVSMGTTVVILLLTQERYYIMTVGDSRAYEISDQLLQLTEDQTLVAREVKEGRLTLEEALADSRRNVLLQCVGASEQVYPEMFFGETKQNAVYMLCSDGFVHEITKEEIYQQLQPGNLSSREEIRNRTEYLIETVKEREERDNITVAVIKTQ